MEIQAVQTHKDLKDPVMTQTASLLFETLIQMESKSMKRTNWNFHPIIAEAL